MKKKRTQSRNQFEKENSTKRSTGKDQLKAFDNIINELTNFMVYGNRRFKAAFTRAL